VGDEDNLRRGLRVHLELDGFRLRTVADLGAARAALAERPADLVVLDASLPDGDGFQFTAGRRRRWDGVVASAGEDADPRRPARFVSVRAGGLQVPALSPVTGSSAGPRRGPRRIIGGASGVAPRPGRVPR